MNGPLQPCNLFALAQGLDPIGYAGTFDAFLAFELPLPWPRGLFDSRGKLPAGVHEAVARYRREAPYRLSLMALAPDPEYGRAGRRRIVWCSRPAGAFAEYDRAEYLVPEGLVGEAVAALIHRRGAVAELVPFRVAATARDLLVCTHGSQDAACGLFGVPVYQQLRAGAGGGTRVWRVSHFGGHLFAPTVLELPSGRLWAYLDEASAATLLTREPPAAELRGHYRGWAALEGPFLQALERALLVREGWRWLALRKRGAVLERDPAAAPLWQRVRIAVEGAGGDAGAEIGGSGGYGGAHGGGYEVGSKVGSEVGPVVAYEALVELQRHVEVRPRSDSPERLPYAQYRVTSLSAEPRRPAATVAP